MTNPDSGSATEEIEVEYDADPLDIGFNSRYLLDIAAQLDGEVAVLRLADPGSPTLIQDKDAKGALYVLMPMRVRSRARDTSGQPTPLVASTNSMATPLATAQVPPASTASR